MSLYNNKISKRELRLLSYSVGDQNPISSVLLPKNNNQHYFLFGIIL